MKRNPVKARARPAGSGGPIGSVCRIGSFVLGLLATMPTPAAEIEVLVNGVDEELERNVRAFLRIERLAGELETAADGNGQALTDAEIERRVARAHSNARTEIEQALRPFGYYAPRIETSLAPIEEGWSAVYTITPGQPVRFNEVDLAVSGEGRESEPLRAALREIDIEPGSIARHADYDRARSLLFDRAYNGGYLDAAFTRAELAVRPAARTADVHLHLETGRQYFFGDVVVQQDILSDEFLGRLVDIEPGDPFDSDRLINLQLMLGDTGYFQDVTTTILREQAADQRIPVLVNTTPRPNQQFTVGFGYGTDTGPRLRLGIELRRLNRNGHRFQADLRTSARESTVAGEYRVPVGDLTTDYISYRASLGLEDIGDLETEQISAGASWHDFWRELQRSVHIEAHRENFQTDLTPKRTAEALFVGVRLSSRRADDQLFTRRGHAWAVDLRGGSRQLGSSTSFSRLTLDGELVRPLGERGRLLTRGAYGAIRADSIAQIIPSLRFFTGGDRSVRGYEFESLGPADANGATIGGRYLAVASVEVDYLFAGNFGGALFYDVGNASNDPTPDLKRGAGIGLRWRSPVGMLKVDFAHPFDDPDENFRLHLSIGAAL